MNTRHAAMKNRVVAFFVFFSPSCSFLGPFGRAMSCGAAPLLKCIHLWESQSHPRLYPGGIWGENRPYYYFLFFFANMHTHTNAHRHRFPQKSKTFFFFYTSLSSTFVIPRAYVWELHLFVWCLPFLTFTRAGWTVFDRWRKIILPWCFIVDM